MKIAIAVVKCHLRGHVPELNQTISNMLLELVAQGVYFKRAMSNRTNKIKSPDVNLPTINSEIEFEWAAAWVYFGHTVLIRGVVPQIQIAIRSVVTIGLAVGCAAKPPRRTIRSHPCGLGCNARAHGVGCASPTTILGARHINDPMRRAQRGGG